MNKIVLFDNKKDCCACSACMNICPKSAIEFVQDEYGFKYPQINEDKCIIDFRKNIYKDDFND